MDAQLVEKIVHEVKSQGVFDEFRKDSMADVDTKPAYQNLRQRVENNVKKFLAEQKWTPEANKNQLREKLRRHITESGFLDVGVERIVDQVVNPKIGSVFQPRIEEIAYKYLGLPPPPKKIEPPPPPLMHPLPPLPLNAPPLKVETCSLLPTDLEQVSPDSDKGTVKSEGKDDRTTVDMETDDKLPEDEDESPPFEPLVKQDFEDIKYEKQIKKEMEDNNNIKQERDFPLETDKKPKPEESNDGHIKAEINDNTSSQDFSNFACNSIVVDKDASQSVDARISQDSQLSSVSSDSHLSVNGKGDSLQSSSQEAVSANISEEAQMPKFNENSCEPNNSNGYSYETCAVKSRLHFDIKKDEIKFEGTEWKTGLETPDSATVKTEEEKFSNTASANPVLENKNDSFKFSSTNSNMDAKEEEFEHTPLAQELSFGSSIDDSLSIPNTNTPKSTVQQKEQEESPQIQTVKQVVPTTPMTPTPILTPSMPTPTATPSPITSHKADKEHQSRHSSSSSSRHKKHSKERRRSHEREREKDSSRDRHRSSKDGKESSKYRSSSSGTKSSKHSSSSSSKYSSSHNRSSTSEKDLEKSSSSSTHSSSKHIKHSHSHSSSSSNENQDTKKSKRDSDRRHHSSSSSNNQRENTSSSSSKRPERKDDHTEAKHKTQRRKSTDSNDDDGDKSYGGGGGGCVGKSGSQSKSSYATTSNSKSSKSKSSNSDMTKSPSTKTNGSQRDNIDCDEQYNEEAVPKTNYPNNVVILNDILENPQTQFIQLNNTGHLVEIPSQKLCCIATELKSPEISEFNNNIEPLTSKKEQEKCLSNNSLDLMYFEQIHLNLHERLKLLNGTMDLCRNAVNSLRFDSLSDEGIELSNEEDLNTDDRTNSLMATLKRKSDYNYEEYERTPRKRMASNESEECQVKTSPAPSDSSANSKENEEIPKNTDHTQKSLVDRHKAAQKLTQQQRYSSEDLYKPRPILGQRSRRRGMDSLI